MKELLTSAPPQQQPMEASSSQLSFSQQTQSDEQLPDVATASLPENSAAQPMPIVAAPGTALGQSKQISVPEIAKVHLLI